MVFFTCGACGESLKKVQVEKHVQICRGCESVSCMDCGRDFWGEEFRNHIRCISEDQKYGGRGFEAKANKGDVKQQQWIQKIQGALSQPGLSSRLKSVLQQVATYDNVPRNKNKFQKWMKNSLRISDSSLQQQVWDVLSAEKPAVEASSEVTENGAEKKKMKKEEVSSSEVTENGAEKKKLNKRERKEARRQKNGVRPDLDQNQNQNQDQNQDQNQEVRQRKRTHGEENGPEKKKRKKQPEGAEPAEPVEAEPEGAGPKGKFNWKGNIKAVLRAAPDQELSVKKLRKKVLNAYSAFAAVAAAEREKPQEEILALFNKKIHKNPKLRILKDRVRLLP